MNFTLDDPHRNQELLEKILNELEISSFDLPEEINSGEYGNSGYTRFYIERDVGRLGDALDDNELKQWAVDRMVEIHQTLKPVLDEELA